jgi:hypothetical protein
MKSVKLFNKCFWNGPQGEHAPSDSLKAQRMQLGILVKGKRLDLCPPPCDDIFSNINIDCDVNAYLKRLNIDKPSVIQMQAWPALLSGSDVLGYVLLYKDTFAVLNHIYYLV